MDLAVSEFRLARAADVRRHRPRRQRAEAGGGLTLKFLADASTTLAGLVDYESTLRRVASLTVPFFADWCAVDMLEPDGSVRRVAMLHRDPAKMDERGNGEPLSPRLRDGAGPAEGVADRPLGIGLRPSRRRHAGGFRGTKTTCGCCRRWA